MYKVTADSPKAKSCRVRRGSRRSRSIPQHICSACGKAQSSTYQAQHPLTPRDVPIPGICSRPKCARVGYSAIPTESPLPTIIIYEIHQHYHISSCLSTSSPSATTPVELPGEEALYRRAELSGEEVPNIKGYLERRLPLFLKEPSPPPVCNWSKPTIHNS
jgi:hypothetical protein